MIKLLKKKISIAFLLLILLIGLILRSWELSIRSFPNPDMSVYLIFGKYYLDLLLGNTPPIAPLDPFAKPGYMLLSSMGVFLFGFKEISLHIVNLFFGLISIILAYKIVTLTKKSDFAALLSCLAIAVSPSIITLDRSGLTHTVNGFFIIFGTFFYVLYLKKNSLKYLYGGGFLFGVSTLFHPISIIFFPVIFFIEIINQLNYKQGSFAEKIKSLLIFGTFLMVPIFATDIIYRVIFWINPALGKIQNVPGLRIHFQGTSLVRGYLNDIFSHQAVSDIPENNYTFFFTFIANSITIKSWALILQITMISSIVWYIYKIFIYKKIEDILLFLLPMLPLLLWSIQQSRSHYFRFLYPLFPLFFILIGTSIADLLSTKRIKIMKWFHGGIIVVIISATIICNGISFFKINARSPTINKEAVNMVIKQAKRFGYEKIFFYGYFKAFTWDYYLNKWYNENIYELALNGKNYANNIRDLLKKTKLINADLLIFLNPKKHFDKETTINFLKFKKQYGLKKVSLFNAEMSGIEFFELNHIIK